MKEGEREQRAYCLFMFVFGVVIYQEGGGGLKPLPITVSLLLLSSRNPSTFPFLFFFEKAMDLFPNRHSSLSCVGTQAMTTSYDHIKCSQALIVECIPIKLAINNHRLSIGEKIKAIIVYKLMQSPTFSMHIIDLERTRLQS